MGVAVSLADNGSGPFLDNGTENGNFLVGAFNWEALSSGIVDIHIDESSVVDGQEIDVTYDSLSILVDQQKKFVLGDVTGDGVVDLLDIDPFKTLIVNGEYDIRADINGDDEVNLLDVAPFTALLID